MNKDNLVFYRVRIDENLLKYFRKIIKLNKTTQQAFFDNTIKEYIIKNISLVVNEDNNK